MELEEEMEEEVRTGDCQDVILGALTTLLGGVGVFVGTTRETALVPGAVCAGLLGLASTEPLGFVDAEGRVVS